MSTVLSSILRIAARRAGEPMNIITFPTHEAYQSELARTGHNWFLWRQPGIKDWNRTFRPLPANHTLLDPESGGEQLPPDVVFDLVISQNKMGSPSSQFTVADEIARTLYIPHLSLEHTLPHPDWNQGLILRLKQMRADANVFISDYSRDAWLWGAEEATVVHHGIDTELFRPLSDDAIRRPVLLSVVNDWMHRDWCCGFKFWQEVTKDLPCFVVGDTPGLSKPAATIDELVWRYQTAEIFVNTSTVSPVPTALLEAMASGCAVVSTDNCMILDVIVDGQNGYRTNDKARFRRLLESLLDDPAECLRLGQAARQTILRDFSQSDFVANWNRVLNDTADTLPRVRDSQDRPIRTENESCRKHT